MDLDDKMKIWLYWENMPGSQMPMYLQICYEIVGELCKSCDVILVSNHSLAEYLPNINLDLNSIRLQGSDKNALALKADYLRVALLQKYGGIWLDMDCVVLKDLGPIFEEVLKEYDFYGMYKEKGWVVNNIMASRKNGVVMTEYLEAMTDHLTKKLKTNDPFSWLEIGATMLTPIVEKHNELCYLEPEENFHPVDSSESKILWQRSDSLKLEDYVTEDTKVFMLYNKLFTDVQKSYTRKQILNRNCLIGQLVRRCLPQQTVTAAYDREERSSLNLNDVAILFIAKSHPKACLEFVQSVREHIGDDVSILCANQGKDNPEYKIVEERYACNVVRVADSLDLRAIYDKLFEQTDRKIVCVCSDTFVFDDRTDIAEALRLLSQNDTIDVLGSAVEQYNYDKKGKNAGEPFLRESNFLLWRKGDSQRIMPAQYVEISKKYLDHFSYIQKVDMVGGVTLFRRNVFENINILWHEGSCLIYERKETVDGVPCKDENSLNLYSTNLFCTQSHRGIYQEKNTEVVSDMLPADSKHLMVYGGKNVFLQQDESVKTTEELFWNP